MTKEFLYIMGWIVLNFVLASAGIFINDWHWWAILGIVAWMLFWISSI